MPNYYVLIEQNDDSAFGLTFLDFPSVFSAADREEDIVPNATEALRLWAEDVVLPEPIALSAIHMREDVKAALLEGGRLLAIPLPTA